MSVPSRRRSACQDPAQSAATHIARSSCLQFSCRQDFSFLFLLCVFGLGVSPKISRQSSKIPKISHSHAEHTEELYTTLFRSRDITQRRKAAKSRRASEH